MVSVYEKIGGDAALEAAVEIFYRKVVADPRISRFFDKVDIDRQRVRLTSFLAVAFGGPNTYTGKDMREAHKHMKLTEEHFNAVAEQLVATLEELNVPADHITEIMEIALSVKDDVLNR